MRQKRTNIIMLVGEDTGLHLGCYGNAYAHTPHLDGLAGEGARYTHAFSTSPVCAPSRACMVTGRYPWSLGTHQMRSRLLNPPRLFPHELRDAGYYVNWANKTDFNFEPPEDFAQETSDWVDDLASGRLNDKPFFLFMNFAVTHESTLWLPDDRVEGHMAGKPAPPARHDPAEAPVPDYLPDTPNVRQNIARYYDALTQQDEQIGRVLAALDRSGQRDNTMVIYLTDHGRGLVREKRWCYAAGIHLPLIVRWPGQVEPATVEDRLVSWVDVAPTILSIAGVDRSSGYQGQVFMGPQASAPRAHVFAGRDRMDETFDRVRVARDARWHYIRNDFPRLPYAQRNKYMERSETTQAVRELGARGELNAAQRLWLAEVKPAEELYDAQADPQMVHNLADDEGYAEILTRMRGALDDHLREVGDLGREPERKQIERGLVDDQLAYYHERVAPLPAEYAIGPERTIVELPDAEAWEAAGA